MILFVFTKMIKNGNFEDLARPSPLLFLLYLSLYFVLMGSRNNKHPGIGMWIVSQVLFFKRRLSYRFLL